VVGRRIWETWHITKNLLEARDPNIHDLIYEVILDYARDCVVPISQFEPTSFQDLIDSHPKVLIRW
jgi:threonine 3-dehydrogenase